MSGHELGERNVCVAEECGVDDCEGQLEENSKATFDINGHECNVITDTEDNIGIIFKLEGNDVKVSLSDFGSYVMFNKECLHKGYKCIPHCPAICSTCCRTKVAQIEMYEHNWKIQ
jgi:hypothetical protein